jgi:hypothetical protein
MNKGYLKLSEAEETPHCFASHDDDVRKEKPSKGRHRRIARDYDGLANTRERTSTCTKLRKSTSHIATVDFSLVCCTGVYLCFSASVEVSTRQIAATPLVATSNAFPIGTRA